MGKHTKSDLLQMQSLPLEAKINMSKRRIREWFEHYEGNVYLSFSGGKDSTVLRHLIMNTPGVYDVPSVFVDTGLEYPEVRRFAIERSDVVLRPEMRFNEVIKTYGYPFPTKVIAKMVDQRRRGYQGYAKNFDGTAVDKNGMPSRYNCSKWKPLLEVDFAVSAKCCDIMKKKPGATYEKETGRKPYFGTMASESMVRENAWRKNGCNAFEATKPSSQPLSFWSDQDVLKYILENGVEISSVYGDVVQQGGKLKTTGCKRTGCLFCAFGCHLEKGEARFEQLRRTHPRQWNYCINGGEYDEEGRWIPNSKGLGMGHIFDEVNKIYGEGFVRYGGKGEQLTFEDCR